MQDFHHQLVEISAAQIQHLYAKLEADRCQRRRHQFTCDGCVSIKGCLIKREVDGWAEKIVKLKTIIGE
jgi:hypothetical protein